MNIKDVETLKELLNQVILQSDEMAKSYSNARWGKDHVRWSIDFIGRSGVNIDFLPDDLPGVPEFDLSVELPLECCAFPELSTEIGGFDRKADSTRAWQVVT